MESVMMPNYTRESNNNGNKFISLDKLTIAIHTKANYKGKSFSKEEARAIAEHALNFFMPGIDRIIDNSLLPEDRDAFYILEDAGLFGIEKEDTILYDGRDWHIHYWFMHKDKIKDAAQLVREKQPIQAKKDDFNYENVTEEVWAHGNRTYKSIKSPQDNYQKWQ